MRLKVVALQQIGGGVHCPSGLDAGSLGGIQASGFDQFRRHHPARLLAVQGRGRKHGELAITGPQIETIVSLAAELVKRAANNGAVYLDRKSTRLNSSHVKISYA